MQDHVLAQDFILNRQDFCVYTQVLRCPVAFTLCTTVAEEKFYVLKNGCHIKGKSKKKKS